MIAAGQHYALRDVDAWWYYLPETATNAAAILYVYDEQGREMVPGNRPGWWMTTGETGRAAVVRRTPAPVVGYERTGAVAEHLIGSWPQRLTPEEWNERVGGLDYDDTIRMLHHEAYSAVRGDEGDERVDVDLSDRLVLEGQPPDAVPEGARWVADLPWELRERAEYLHLFPGRLEGFRATVTRRLDAMPGVSAYDHSAWSCFARVGGSLKELVKAGYLTPPPRSVASNSLETAARMWEAGLDAYEVTVRDLTSKAVCPRCGGTGEAPSHEPDEARVRRVADRFLTAAGTSKALRSVAGRWARMAVEELG